MILLQLPPAFPDAVAGTVGGLPTGHPQVTGSVCGQPPNTTTAVPQLLYLCLMASQAQGGQQPGLGSGQYSLQQRPSGDGWELLGKPPSSSPITATRLRRARHNHPRAPAGLSPETPLLSSAFLCPALPTGSPKSLSQGLLREHPNPGRSRATLTWQPRVPVQLCPQSVSAQSSAGRLEPPAGGAAAATQPPSQEHLPSPVPPQGLARGRQAGSTSPAWQPRCWGRKGPTPTHSPGLVLSRQGGAGCSWCPPNASWNKATMFTASNEGLRCVVLSGHPAAVSSVPGLRSPRLR